MFEDEAILGALELGMVLGGGGGEDQRFNSPLCIFSH